MSLKVWLGTTKIQVQKKIFMFLPHSSSMLELCWTSCSLCEHAVKSFQQQPSHNYWPNCWRIIAHFKLTSATHTFQNLSFLLQPTFCFNTYKTLQSSNKYVSSSFSQASYITSSLAVDTYTHDACCEFTRAGAHCDILDFICSNTSLFENIWGVEVNLPREEI